MRTWKNVFIFLALMVLKTATPAQDSINHRIILIGDAGKLTDGRQPVLELLQSTYRLDAQTSLVYLGDNIYPKGLPNDKAESFDAKRKILQLQISVAKDSQTHTFFIPGNHDWKKGKKDGWQQVRNQFNYIQSLKEGNIHFLPENGCPGPEEISLSDKVVLVITDTQWWLHQNDKPGEASDCACKTTDEVITALKDIVYRNRNKLLLHASHHPFKTYGPHGGYFTLRQHIFPLTDLNSSLYVPLPVIGSLYPLSRTIFGDIQDTKHPVYKRMVRSIDTVLNMHPYCIRVSGHEHTLQLIKDREQTYIVSGSGSKSNSVKKGALTAFRSPKQGFAVLEILKSGSVWIKFFSVSQTPHQQPLFADHLRSFNPVIEKQAAKVPFSFPDSITTVGSLDYKSKRLKEFFLGKNYRNEWREPIRVRVFNISSELGGLRPLQRGGGKQSKSLRLAASDGKEYVLRSIDKIPDKALPEELRQTFVRDIVKDGISASYPYSALSVPPLASAAGIPHARPQLVMVPDDAQLGIYQSDFANTLCSFEEREPGKFEKTYSTDKVYEKLLEDNDHLIDQKAVLNARLLDMFIMDFDRHEDQWRWGAIEKKNEKAFFPIPRDRDQAFFINNGLLPRMASRPWLVPQLQGLRAHVKNIKGFNLAARNFDRSFLHEPSKEDWKKATMEFVSQMSDSTIEAALHEQPEAVFKFSGEKIIKILKERRNYLQEEALTYYKFLSKEVNVVGSDHKELFDVVRNEEGSVLVTVYKVNKEGEASKKIYERRLVRDETKEIRLFGMGGDDKFNIKGNSTRSIKLRVIGGTGNDTVSNSGPGTGNAKTIIYDLITEKNYFTGNARKKLSENAQINHLDRRGFNYNILAPFISVSYNQDDGLYLGASLKYTAHGFRKEPYKLLHQVSVNHALATRAFHFNYKLEAIDVIGKLDVVFNGNIKAPNNTINFFKYGNETVYIKRKSEGIRYYRARFNLAEAAVLVRANPSAHFALAAGPVFQYYQMNRSDNKDRLIFFPSLNGLDSNTVYKTKTYTGIQLSTGFDNRDNKILPSRGVNWQTSFRLNKGLNNAASNFSQLNSDLSVFTSFQSPARLVIAARVGGGVNFGRYEFFQAQYLSSTENLRGFRKYRFAGDKMFYSNTEIRFKLVDINTYLFPGALGILGFYDVGRVWLKGEYSKKWHKGYGGGLWLSPLSRFVITALYTTSDEGGLPLISFGFQF